MQFIKPKLLWCQDHQTQVKIVKPSAEIMIFFFFFDSEIVILRVWVWVFALLLSSLFEGKNYLEFWGIGRKEWNGSGEKEKEK